MSRASYFAVPLASATLLVLVAQGCGDAPQLAPFSPGSKKDSGDEGICLLNNCKLDRDCGDCDSDRTTCFVEEKRCIACGPNANDKKCKAGLSCTKYGTCVAAGKTCAEDAAGVPTITCKTNTDCAACGPKFQVCDATAGKCVGCAPTNTKNCQSTDMCVAGTCAAKCPATCNTDSDCGQCGAPGKAAQACNKHICAECSTTKPCTDGRSCDLSKGTCVTTCGTARDGKNTCTVDGSCAGCLGTNKCKRPVNGGEGVCASDAPGCSDLGKSVIVLPDPFSRVTNACSNDNDCSAVGVDVNVGKIVRDFSGIGLVKDGNLSYPMRTCASVELFGKSCGVCVPCNDDSDCKDISATSIAGDIFGPDGSSAASVVLDKVFGARDPTIHMFCQQVAAGYGVCLPCPNLLEECVQTSKNVPASGTCNHDLCQTGDALGQNCDPCVTQVCAKDPHCCTSKWDEQCKQDVDQLCTDKTCTPDTCAFRPAGWYCFSEKSKGGYECTGTSGQEQIARGRQCGANQECRTEGTGPKAGAILCTSEGQNVPGCPTGTLGTPKCFDK